MGLFSDHEPLDDISNRLAIPSLVFCILTPLVVLARFTVRRSHDNYIGADDWTILASLVFAQAVNVQMIICCQWGFGKHTDQLSPITVNKTLHMYFYAQILYKLNIGLTKISILIFYLRVFDVLRWFKILCWSVVAVVLSFTIASVTISIFQCSPVRYAYDKSGPKGSCIDLTKFWYGNAGYNIGTDMIIIIIPILVIRRLHVPKRSRIALAALFGLGIFVCITSILRFTTLNISTVRTDSMWQSIDSSMWTIIESNLAIIVACIPALRHAIGHFFPFLIGKVRNSATSSDVSRSKSKSKSRTVPATTITHNHGGDGGGNSNINSSSSTRIGQDSRLEKNIVGINNNHSDNHSDSTTTSNFRSKPATWLHHDTDDFEDQDDHDNPAINTDTKTLVTKSVTTKAEVYDLDEIAEDARRSTRAMV